MAGKKKKKSSGPVIGLRSLLNLAMRTAGSLEGTKRVVSICDDSRRAFTLVEFDDARRCLELWSTTAIGTPTEGSGIRTACLQFERGQVVSLWRALRPSVPILDQLADESDQSSIVT